MKNYTITKEQILELSKYYGITHILKRIIPDAFKLDDDKWQISSLGHMFFNNEKMYGFLSGKWIEKDLFGDHQLTDKELYHWRTATAEEVKSALIAEAKNRFKVGDKIKRSFDEGLDDVYIDTNIFFNDQEYLYSHSENYLEYHGFLVYSKGQWATVILEDKQVIPMQKALKIIAKKLKTSPENIEIKN